MMKKPKYPALLTLFLAAAAGAVKPALANESTDIYARRLTGQYHLTVTVAVRNENVRLKKLVVTMPLPQSSAYQEVANLQTGTGEILNIPGSADKYIRFLLDGSELGQGSQRELSYRCESPCTTWPPISVASRPFIPMIKAIPSTCVIPARAAPTSTPPKAASGHRRSALAGIEGPPGLRQTLL